MIRFVLYVMMFVLYVMSPSPTTGPDILKTVAILDMSGHEVFIRFYDVLSIQISLSCQVIKGKFGSLHKGLQQP